MTLRMADGPVANLPAGMDAYAGYSDESGIGVTWPEVEKLAAKYHLSISVHGQAPAMCGDVENGALSSWVGYDYGYCAVSNVNDMIAKYGRPRKLWTAHYDPSIGSHICSSACWPGLVTTADGTQWTDHNNVWDESLLSDDFFGTPDPTPSQPKEDPMLSPPVQFKPGQIDVFQVTDGVLWHKWLISGKWGNENVAQEAKVGPSFPDQEPKVAIIGGQILVTAEDDDKNGWYFAQSADKGGWGANQLP